MHTRKHTEYTFVNKHTRARTKTSAETKGCNEQLTITKTFMFIGPGVENHNPIKTVTTIKFKREHPNHSLTS